MSTTADAAPVVQLPSRIQTYLDVLVGACTAAGPPLVSVILFGSTVRGGFSNISDVDLIIVLPDSATREDKARIRDEVARLETVHGFRPATTHPIGAFQARVERAVGHLFACLVCTRSDLLSGDVARIIGLQPVEALLIDRIVFSGIISSAVTVRGEDLLPHVLKRSGACRAQSPARCCGGVLLSIGTFPCCPTPPLRHGSCHLLHSCFFYITTARPGWRRK